MLSHILALSEKIFAGGKVSQLESFASYIERLITVENLAWIGLLWLASYLFRKPLARFAGVSTNRFLLIALAFAGVIGLSLRFWVMTGTLSTFWLVAPELWASPFRINANFLLNTFLYMPPAVLLVLARKSWWRVGLFLAVLSFVIETIQQYVRIGQADPMDLFANGFGTILGISIGLLLAKYRPALLAK